MIGKSTGSRTSDALQIEFLCPNLVAGGAERHWAMLIPRLIQRGLDVRVRTLDGRGEIWPDLERAGVDIAQLSPREVLSEATQAPPDVVVTRGFSAHGVGALVAVRTGAAWVINWHRQPELAIKPHRRLMLRLLASRADMVIAVHERQLTMLEPLRLRARAMVIPNGTDMEKPAQPERIASRRSLDGNIDAFVAVMVAALRPEKRADIFIEACLGAARTCPRLQAWLVGEGVERPKLEQMSGDGSVVKLLGYRADIPSILAAADVACLTSEAEAAPLSLLEAMACELPVIATDVGANAMLVSHGITGLLVSAGDVNGLTDAVVALYNDPDRARSFGEAGRKRQQREFTADLMADRYSAALRQAGLARRRGSLALSEA